MNRIYIFIALASLLAFAGCRSSKSAVETSAYDAAAGHAPTFGAVAANYGDWADVSVPITLRLIAPDNISVSARARMVRGSCIDLSFRVLGFEVARVWISQDSIVAASRPKKICFAESLTNLMAGLPVNLGNLQDLLMGRPFMPGGGTIAMADSTAMYLTTVDGATRLLPRRQPSQADYGYTVDISSVVTALAVVVLDPDVTFTASYSGPRPLTPAGSLMDAAELVVATPNADYAASVAWKWGSAEWNGLLAVEPPSIEGLRRVTLAQLIKMVKSM